MSRQLLDLTSAEVDRVPVKIDSSGTTYYLASPDDFGPREMAKLARMEKLSQVADEDFNEDLANEAEQAMTDAACLVLPEAPNEVVAQLPFLKRAKLVEAFMVGFGQASQPQEAPNPST